MEVISRVLAILTLIAINAFFVAAEFALVSVRRTRIQQLVQEGDIQAKTVQKLQRDLERLLSTTQLGITLSSLALGWIGESTIASMIADGLNYWPVAHAWGPWVIHSISIPVAFVAIAYLQIVLGELCPKTLALSYSEKFARFLGPISLSISYLFTPIISILNQSNRLLLRILKVPIIPNSNLDAVTFKELQIIIESSSENSNLQADERELLRNVFESGEVQVEEVMIPRTSIHAIEAEATVQNFLEEVARTGHDYYPVIDESLDQVRGIIYYKDVICQLPVQPLDFTNSIQPWIQTAWFVPAETPIQDVLQMMQKYKLGVAMVRESEFNGTAGLITLQDLMRAIIGIEDEAPSAEDVQITEQDNHTFIIQAQTDLEVINEQLDLNLPILEDYQTLGGFLMFYLQKIPEIGEIFYYEDLEIKILSNHGPRLDRILIHRSDSSPNFLLEPDDTLSKSRDFEAR
jgi:CBS domain containing-hemolysin-like protein